MIRQIFGFAEVNSTIDHSPRGVTLLLIIFLFLLQVGCALQMYAQEPKLLRATVEENALARTRIKHFDDSASQLVQPELKTRIHRTSSTINEAQKSPNQEILPEFAKVDPALFTATKTKPYDIEAESNSRQLMIAWELWHKQLAQAMYKRVSLLAEGGCAYKLTVTRDHHLTIKILQSLGSPLLRQEVVAAAESLDGNPGLSFPEGSLREVAYDSLAVICGRNIHPGFDWEHGDFERIKVDW